MNDCINIEKLRLYKDEIINFLNQKSYPEYEKDDCIKRILKETNNIGLVLYQLYSKFGIIDQEKDIYFYFYKLLSKYNLLNTNCCEVAAGYYPRLSEIVYPTIKNNNKQLTIYDPKIIVDKLFDTTIKKEEFNKETDLNGIDTLFGTFTCEATIDMVEQALMYNKNLLISLCPCNHETEKYPMNSQYYLNKKINDIINKKGSISLEELPFVYWYDCFCDMIKKEYGDRIKILNWPSIYGREEPILLSVTEEHKRKCLKI